MLVDPSPDGAIPIVHDDRDGHFFFDPFLPFFPFDGSVPENPGTVIRSVWLSVGPICRDSTVHERCGGWEACGYVSNYVSRMHMFNRPQTSLEDYF